MALTGKERRYLRGLAHSLQPVVHVGHRGVSAALLVQVAESLETHELIKVKVAAECPDDRGAVATTLAERTNSEVAGEIGRVIILYRARREDPTIQLPRQPPAEGPE